MTPRLLTTTVRSTSTTAMIPMTAMTASTTAIASSAVLYEAVPQVAMLVKRLHARFDAWDARKGDYDTPEVHVPYRANAADAIAKGDDSVWAAADVVERIPLIGKPHEFPADGTRVLFLHDKKSLFVRFECADSKMSEAFAKPYDPSVEFFPSGDHWISE